METIYQSVFTYLSSFGYVKSSNLNEQFISLRSGGVTLIHPYRNPGFSMPPTIFIDDRPLHQNDTKFNKELNIRILRELSMHEVDEIFINKIGGGTGSRGGTIKIYLKNGNHKYIEEEEQNLYEELVLKTGFDRANQYYKPFL